MMRYLTIAAALLVLVVVSCESKRWWRRAKKTVELKPHLGKDGDLTISGGISISWRRKRDTEKQGKFNIELMLDPCVLTSYDITRDGLVTQEEIKLIFDNSELAGVFFTQADENGDNQISGSEFKTISRRINQCQEEM